MNITPLLQAVISLVSVIITMFLIPYIKSRQNNEELKKVLDVVQIVVKSAEQLGMTMGYDGEKKKEYVIDRLSDMGFIVDDSLNDYIEACVLELHHELVK